MDMFKDQVLAEIERCSAICSEREDCEGCPCLRDANEGCPCLRDASELVIFAAPYTCYLESLYQIKRSMRYDR